MSFPQRDKPIAKVCLLRPLVVRRPNRWITLDAESASGSCWTRPPIVRECSPPYSELPDRPMKTCVARWAFLLVLVFIGFLWGERAFSAEVQRIGIVSAFDPELKAVEQAIIPQNAESKIKQVNGTRFRLVDLYGKHLYFFLSGVSMVNAALTTQMAIDHFQLDAIIFSGIAGAVDPKLKPGDVVVPAHWIHQIE
jgi:hypothetical protein